RHRRAGGAGFGGGRAAGRAHADGAAGRQAAAVLRDRAGGAGGTDAGQRLRRIAGRGPGMTMTDASQWRERRIAALLHYGTWLASWLLGEPPWAGLLASVGIGVFIALPVLRVALMLVIFLRERDYLYSALALAVLAIIAAALAVGLLASTG